LCTISPMTRLRELRDSDPGYERCVWDELAEAGWTGILVAEELGGMGLGLRAACTIATQVGRNPLPEPYMAGAWHASTILNGLPQTALRDELLTDIASGKAIIGVAWQNAEEAAPFTVREE